MATPFTRDTLARQGFTLSQAVQEELERLQADGQLGDGSKTEPRCYVCCEAESKSLVNKLLAAGLTNREVAESCEAINGRRRSVRDTRLIDAEHVYRHRKAHFRVDEPALAVYRHIVERYAEQANIDHINGVASAVSPLAVFHTVMAKGFGGVVDGDKEISVKETMEAAKTLHELLSRDAGQKKMADIMFMMDRIVTAAQAFVPVDKQEAFLAMVEGREQMPELTEHVQRITTAAVREFAPRSTTDERDAL